MAASKSKKMKRNGKKRAVIGSIAAFILLAAIVLIIRFHVFDGLFSSCFGGNAVDLPDVLPGLPKRGELSVYNFDVGQGNAALLVSPNGRTMLIDGGPPEYAERTVETIHALGVESLDIVIATHPHLDHIGGMPRILREFHVGEYIMPAVDFDCAAQPSVDIALEREMIPARMVRRGDTVAWDSACTVTVLSPIPGCEYSTEDANDLSLIIRVEFGETSILFTGDATVHTEQLMMFHNERELIGSDVLIVAHHGSTTSSSFGFLETVGAKYAVISVGRDNPYGHPDHDILKRLKAVGTKVYRTDEEGWISILSDGTDVRVITQKDKN